MNSLLTQLPKASARMSEPYFSLTVKSQRLSASVELMRAGTKKVNVGVH
jgi:hypothetical protein